MSRLKPESEFKLNYNLYASNLAHHQLKNALHIKQNGIILFG